MQIDSALLFCCFSCFYYCLDDFNIDSMALFISNEAASCLGGNSLKVSKCSFKRPIAG